MKMKTMLLITLIATSFVACNQENLTCLAYSSDGTELYEVMGSEVCENQIDISEGEYCQCSE